MGFNRRKMEDQRRQVAEEEAAARRATDAQVLEDAERNERQALRAPMIFSPTIGATITAGYWFLGCAVRLAERSTRSTCAYSIVIPTRQCRASFPRCPAAHAGRTRHSPS